jgi:pSer/pThr/pTyr-binding forkhead associated (FHA) protein
MAPEEPPPEEPDLQTTVILKTQGARSRVVNERAHYLVVVEGAEAGSHIELGSKPVILGRVAPADLVLDDTQISRRHCRVSVVLDDVFVSDLDSANGTFIDGKRITANAFLPVGGRLQVGTRVLDHEWRSRSEMQASRELDSELESASRYVLSLIPPALESGPIRTEWIIVPCTRLGGDVLGYHFVDDHRFAIYLMDVSGHGAGPAMHAVSVLNVLRGGAMPGVDAGEPAQVAGYLNAMFQMRSHGGLYFTLWYGVYDTRSRSLAYCSAGHHASYLLAPGNGRAQALRTPNVPIGAVKSARFAADRVDVAPGSALYVFSDGVFEVETRAGGLWSIEELAQRIEGPAVPAEPETRRLLDAVRGVSRSPTFDDDFSMVVARFE